jgi:hypothetical protein
MSTARRHLVWLMIYALAMAYVESAVVVYLRALYYPAGFQFPLVQMQWQQVGVEVGREAATIVMLLAAARLASADGWEWFLAFCVAFGIWDIFYYVWLWVFLGWPPSLFTWDVLFLIPVPWIAPVLAPIVVSCALIGGALWLLHLRRQGAALRFSPALWGLAVAGGLAVFLSFTLDFEAALRADLPPPFRWRLFGAGFALSGAALVIGGRRLRH